MIHRLRFAFTLVGVALLATLATEPISADPDDIPDLLEACCDKQGAVPEHSLLQLEYRRTDRLFYHSPRPWMTRTIERRGSVGIDVLAFYRSDTVSAGGVDYPSRTEFGYRELLERDSRGREKSGTTERELERFVLETARYSPIRILYRMRAERSRPVLADDGAHVLYRADIGGLDVELAIRRSDTLLERIVIREADPMLGDVTRIIRYSDFIDATDIDDLGTITLPRRIVVEKSQGVVDETTITRAEFVALTEEPHLVRPESYRVEPDVEEERSVVVEPISDRITSITFPHTESRSLLVEFENFLMAIDVPFDSENGEMLLSKAARIAPEKPVRYFAFGHHHPWYIGGMRPFVHRGATVLATESSSNYVRFLATAPHTIAPDSLELDRQPLRMEMIEKSRTITDGEYFVEIIHIGEESAHTEDYLLFYFPEEKIVMQGDLAWIPESGPLGRPGVREKGLVTAIRDRDLDVETIVQTWPVSDRYQVRSIFPFELLERKVREDEE